MLRRLLLWKAMIRRVQNDHSIEEQTLRSKKYEDHRHLAQISQEEENMLTVAKLRWVSKGIGHIEKWAAINDATEEAVVKNSEPKK